jgi:hypothetical protein
MSFTENSFIINGSLKRRKINIFDFVKITLIINTYKESPKDWDFFTAQYYLILKGTYTVYIRNNGEIQSFELLTINMHMKFEGIITDCSSSTELKIKIISNIEIL